MTNYTVFYVDKTSQTFADTLVMFGLARVVHELIQRLNGAPPELRIEDQGAHYRLTCNPPLDQATLVTQHDPLCPAPFILTPKNAAQLPPDLPPGLILDYEEQKAANNVYYAALKNKVPENERPKPPQHWNILRAINSGALPRYNGLVTDWWSVRHAQAEVLQLILDLYSSTPNDYQAAEDAWKQLNQRFGWSIKARATCLQIYNPDQGKGQNRAKADGLSIGNMDGLWLAEWLKAVGFYEAAITRLVRGAKDRKTLVTAPRELAFNDHQEVMVGFRQSVTSESSIRFDILAAIRYTRALLNYFHNKPDGIAQLIGKRVKQRVVGGFNTAFYKDLGSGSPTMNVSFIALPGWVVVQSAEDVRRYITVLDELTQFVRQFDESHSDAFTLLQYLRDFVSGDDLSAFFRFTNAFPAYYMGKQERNQYARRLSTEFIERLVMSTEERLSEILQSEGFQNIAYAIRQSTVTAQYRKKQGDRKYDVRYGLGQELARKARYPDQFVAALGDFLHKYNAENAQIMETHPGPYRRSVKTTDIDEIVRLIDRFGSETVANLLIAYGYARAPYEEDRTEQEAASEEQSEEEN